MAEYFGDSNSGDSNNNGDRSAADIWSDAGASLLEVDLAALSDAELTQRLLGLEALRSQLEVAALETGGEWDRRQLWALDGARSGGAWLAARCGTALSTARERLRVGRKLPRLTAGRAALAAATITYSHLRILAQALRPETEDLMARDEAMLVAQAQELTVEAFAKAVAHWLEHADPDESARKKRMQREGQSLHVSKTLDGIGVLNGTLDAEATSIVSAELHRVADELWRNEHRQADSTSGVPVVLPAARRAAALVEICRRAASHDAAASPWRTPTPQLMVHVDLNDLASPTGTGSLADGTPVSAEQLRRIGCEASVARLVTRGPSEVLDLGRGARLPSPALRRAVHARDQHCGFPGCTVPPEWCQVHHVIHWADGGETVITNLVLVCHHHHHLLHEGGWTATMSPDQKLQVFRPSGTPLQLHRQNAHLFQPSKSDPNQHPEAA
jgi:hypothetical protein